MSYKKVLENLKAVNHDQRRLAAHVYLYFDEKGQEDCGCALGKGLPLLRDYMRSYAKEPFTYGLAGAKNNDAVIEALVGHKTVPPRFLEGMSCAEARQLQTFNDRTHRYGPEDANTLRNREARYDAVVAWLEEKVAEEDQQ